MRRLGWLAVFTALAGLQPAGAQTQPHVEDCSKGAFIGGRLIYENNCGQAIAVWFLLGGGRVMQRDVAAGGRFDPGVSEARARRAGWISARCAAGFKPTVTVSAANRQAIFDSRYACAKG